MRTYKLVVWNLTRATIVSFLLVVTCRAQMPPETPSAVPSLPADIPGIAKHYSVRIMGMLAGQQAVWTAPDGSVHIFYQYNDRGRGPKTTSILKLDAKGVPVAESVSGNNYLKSHVHENYTLTSGDARWSSNYEKGEKKLAATAIYVPIDQAPWELGLLAKSALGNGGKVGLLPEGEARVDRLDGLNLEFPGRQQHVTLYAISGLDFSPTYVWLDDAGSFFAFANSWFEVIPKGWESTTKQLQAAQDKAARARASELARNLAHAEPNGLCSHTSIFLMLSQPRFSRTKAWSSSGTASAALGPRIKSLRPPVLKSSMGPAKRCCPDCGTCTPTSPIMMGF